MSLNPEQSKIEVTNLIKDFGKKRVVNDLSLSISAGEIVGLLGPNGAGKTTTFYIILGLIEATSGDILLNDASIHDLAMYQRARLGIGYLPQDSSIFKKLSVRDNLKSIAETLPIDTKQQKEKVDALLEDFGLVNIADQMAYTLSGGERRRLEIARSILPSPKFLLMDEPFSGVDPISISEVQKMVLKLKEKNIGILITDHNVRETLKIVDRAYLVYDGSILSEGDSEYLINDPQSRELYLGESFNIN
ncbi:MAG: Lipopolysaccharide export system ATP-binding protein LptB [Puniceicoccaceae bacterium MED-G32]|jgi:lipopolysaccharide export system ATP-binding protein|nr:MAG: Lipopolysaccharide export system ATP-binding protein LptB [Puniceicoccaceae bacterium MED-G32]|tara:strand:+ start:5282 stop:6025 length:744 start_codon:yes stop_codon:yes gene_type:complete